MKKHAKARIRTVYIKCDGKDAYAHNDGTGWKCTHCGQHLKRKCDP